MDDERIFRERPHHPQTQPPAAPHAAPGSRHRSKPGDASLPGPYGDARRIPGAAPRPWTVPGTGNPAGGMPAAENRRFASPPRRPRRGLLFSVLAMVLVGALVGGGIYWYLSSRPAPEETADAYVAAWMSGDYATLDQLATTSEASAFYTEVAENLGVESVEVTTGETVVDGNTATVPFTATLALSHSGTWTYQGELPLQRIDGQWKVEFSPAVLHPQLGPSQTLARTNVWEERGRVRAADGTPVDTPDVSGSIQMIVGQVGPATAEEAAELGPTYREGDPIGQSGIQRSYQEHLAGTPTTVIHVVDQGTPPEQPPGGCDGGRHHRRHPRPGCHPLNRPRSAAGRGRRGDRPAQDDRPGCDPPVHW